ncbi:MAG TPA: L-threonylcarbamoyladenylate synthase [bacterium]|nr:L-threonylcarbamoyladenylate synthase [bacterium]HOL34719.1 L-threonylcarbamoyladenylate synthase [bacterium]HPP08028.1 L-threonylcarbamoyladenylate synthase [bacterium]
MANIVNLLTNSQKEIVEKVIVALKNSGVAIVPTDTVYGLVCDGENDCAKENVYLLKNRPESKPLIGFIRDIEIAKNIAYIPDGFLSFISNRWPGRHTFIFQSKIESSYIVGNDKTIALRIPDYPLINNLCDSFSILASTSANISFSKSACCIEKIDAELLEKVAIVVDGGEILGRESAIWDMTEGIPQLIRGRVLFVCSGNSCRSPMAQALLKNVIGDKKIEVLSAGTDTNFSGRASKATIDVLRETGISIENFVSTLLTEHLVECADLIFVMEEKHRERVLEIMPQAMDKIFVLNVPDPAGGDIFQYREIRDIIKERIEREVLTRIKI